MISVELFTHSVDSRCLHCGAHITDRFRRVFGGDAGRAQKRRIYGWIRAASTIRCCIQDRRIWLRFYLQRRAYRAAHPAHHHTSDIGPSSGKRRVSTIVESVYSPNVLVGGENVSDIDSRTPESTVVLDERRRTCSSTGRCATSG
ncbi:DUF7563 family protein [Halovalidus salilacus]